MPQKNQKRKTSVGAKHHGKDSPFRLRRKVDPDPDTVTDVDSKAESSSKNVIESLKLPFKKRKLGGKLNYSDCTSPESNDSGICLETSFESEKYSRTFAEFEMETSETTEISFKKSHSSVRESEFKLETDNFKSKKIDYMLKPHRRSKKNNSVLNERDNTAWMEKPINRKSLRICLTKLSLNSIKDVEVKRNVTVKPESETSKCKKEIISSLASDVGTSPEKKENIRQVRAALELKAPNNAKTFHSKKYNIRKNNKSHNDSHVVDVDEGIKQNVEEYNHMILKEIIEEPKRNFLKKKKTDAKENFQLIVDHGLNRKQLNGVNDSFLLVNREDLESENQLKKSMTRRKSERIAAKDSNLVLKVDSLVSESENNKSKTQTKSKRKAFPVHEANQTTNKKNLSRRKTVQENISQEQVKLEPEGMKQLAVKENIRLNINQELGQQQLRSVKDRIFIFRANGLESENQQKSKTQRKSKRIAAAENKKDQASNSEKKPVGEKYVRICVPKLNQKSVKNLKKTPKLEVKPESDISKLTLDCESFPFMSNACASSSMEAENVSQIPTPPKLNAPIEVKTVYSNKSKNRGRIEESDSDSDLEEVKKDSKQNLEEQNYLHPRKEVECLKRCNLRTKEKFSENQHKEPNGQRKSIRKTAPVALSETDQASRSKKKPTNKKSLKIAVTQLSQDSIKYSEPAQEFKEKPESRESETKQEIEIPIPSTSDACASSTKEEDILQVLTQHEFNYRRNVEIPISKVIETEDCNNVSSSDSDWEEIEEHREQNIEEYNPVIPKEGVEITIDCPELNIRKRKKKHLDKMEIIRLNVNRELKQQQLNTHKTHLLCLLAHGLLVNNLLNSSFLKALALSHVPNDVFALTAGRKSEKINANVIETIVTWFRNSFSFENVQNPFININENLISYFQDKKALNASEYNLMFIVIARMLGLKTRFCVSFYPLTHKAKYLFKKNSYKKKKNNNDEDISHKEEATKNTENVFLVVNKKNVEEGNKKEICSTDKDTFEDGVDNNTDILPSVTEKRTVRGSNYRKRKKTEKILKVQPKNTKPRPRRSTRKNYKMSSDENDIDDEDFDYEKEIKQIYKRKTSAKLSGKISSSDESDTDDEDFDIEEELELKNVRKSSVGLSKQNSKSDESDIDDKNFVVKERKLKRARKTSAKFSISDESDADDEDFDIAKENKLKSRYKISAGKKGNRNCSYNLQPSLPENSNMNLDSVYCWCEVFIPTNKQWIAIECSNNFINKPYYIEQLLPKPVTYIVACDNQSFIKDVTRRYCPDYMTSNLKLRADTVWWEQTLKPFFPPKSKEDRDEENKLDEMLINKPLPKSLSEYKNHPLYVLEKHLLRYEAIYPPDILPIGFFQKQPIYPRENIVQLRWREKWMKEGRSIRIGEKPYKIVKGNPKWDRINRRILLSTEVPPLELFGFWQTELYKPPAAVGGVVPRNEYGNVELFKSSMLPEGTVHLRNPGINRVAKKLGIDCAPAFIGFDGKGNSFRIMYDGFVVCEEFKDTLLAAWEKEQEIAKKREEEKREKRIYDNWKKLIRGLLIRERIKLKYKVK